MKWYKMTYSCKYTNNRCSFLDSFRTCCCQSMDSSIYTPKYFECGTRKMGCPFILMTRSSGIFLLLERMIIKFDLFTLRANLLTVNQSSVNCFISVSACANSTFMSWPHYIIFVSFANNLAVPCFIHFNSIFLFQACGP